MNPQTAWLASVPWLPWVLLAAGGLNLAFAWKLKRLLARHPDAATGVLRAVPALTLICAGVASAVGVGLLLLR